MNPPALGRRHETRSMMEIVQAAMAGTLESSDLLVKVSPHEEGRLEVVVSSQVMRQFGAQIRKVVHETLARLEVGAGLAVIEDKGALDCAIRARVQAAVLRGAGGHDMAQVLDWEALA
jgi:citrate lyase subunit gamma (acyl carrier protein)